MTRDQLEAELTHIQNEMLEGRDREANGRRMDELRAQLTHPVVAKILLNERAADLIIELGNTLGLSRRDMASTCLAVAANHLMAEGMPLKRAHLAMSGMYAYQRDNPRDGLLVKP